MIAMQTENYYILRLRALVTLYLVLPEHEEALFGRTDSLRESFSAEGRLRVGCGVRGLGGEGWRKWLRAKQFQTKGTG